MANSGRQRSSSSIKMMARSATSGRLVLMSSSILPRSSFSSLYRARKTAPLNFSMVPLMSPLYPIREAAASRTPMTPLPKSLPSLTLSLPTALAIEANIGKIGLSKWTSSHALK